MVVLPPTRPQAIHLLISPDSLRAARKKWLVVSSAERGNLGNYGESVIRGVGVTRTFGMIGKILQHERRQLDQRFGRLEVRRACGRAATLDNPRQVLRRRRYRVRQTKNHRLAQNMSLSGVGFELIDEIRQLLRRHQLIASMIVLHPKHVSNMLGKCQEKTATSFAIIIIAGRCRTESCSNP
jgi:hypothetical protein